jgi:hypothetical protein
VAKHPGRVGLRHRGSLEPAGDRMPKRVKAQAVTFQAQCLELVAELPVHSELVRAGFLDSEPAKAFCAMGYRADA